ncbi:hypothetical protein PUN28_005009 [Cardiocondyla obscurior]|uniref:Uncharacterized protein n=1 Tax=Cardiocondyla obscurior TaxID=286306 RepID=A0AAW2GGA3_9HYME
MRSLTPCKRRDLILTTSLFLFLTFSWWTFVERWRPKFVFVISASTGN